MGVSVRHVTQRSEAMRLICAVRRHHFNVCYVDGVSLESRLNPSWSLSVDKNPCVLLGPLL